MKRLHKGVSILVTLGLIIFNSYNSTIIKSEEVSDTLIIMGEKITGSPGETTDLYNDGTVLYNVDSNTLTLNNANLNYNGVDAAIIMPKTGTISFSGDNTITNSLGSAIKGPISIEGETRNIVFTGTGTLNANGGNANASHGIESAIIVQSGFLKASAQATNGHGVFGAVVGNGGKVQTYATGIGGHGVSGSVEGNGSDFYASSIQGTGINGAVTNKCGVISAEGTPATSGTLSFFSKEIGGTPFDATIFYEDETGSRIEYTGEDSHFYHNLGLFSPPFIEITFPECKVVNPYPPIAPDPEKVASMEVEKTVSTMVAVEGDQVTYSVNVKNTGSVVLNDVNVNDNAFNIIKKEEIIVKVGETVLETGSYLWNGDTLVLNAINVNETITIVYRVIYEESGTFTNVATATASDPTGKQDSIDATDTTTKDVEALNAQLEVVKEASKTDAFAQDVVTYTVSVKNTGNVVLSNVVVTDTVFQDINKELVVLKVDDIVLDSSRYMWKDNEIIISFIEANQIITIIYDVKYNSAGTYTNKVVVEAPNPSDPETTLMDEAEVDKEIHPEPSLNITKEVSTENAFVDGVVTYTIKISNTSSVALKNAVITDTVFSTLDKSDISLQIGETPLDVDRYFWNADKLTIKSIDANEILTMIYQVKYDASGSQKNTIIIEAPNPSDPDTPLKDEAEVDKVVHPQPALEVTKVASSEEADIKDFVTYTVKVKNASSVPLTDVSIKDNVFGLIDEKKVTLQVGSITLASDRYSWQGSTLVIKQMAANEVITIVYQVQYETPGTYKNTVIVEAPNPADPDTPLKDTESINKVVNPEDVSVNITKVANVTSAIVGTPITYTITVMNDGSQNLNNIKINDSVFKLIAHDKVTLSIGNTQLVEDKDYSWNTNVLNINALVSGQTVEIKYIYTHEKVELLKNIAIVEFPNPLNPDENVTEQTEEEVSVVPKPPIVTSPATTVAPNPETTSILLTTTTRTTIISTTTSSTSEEDTTSSAITSSSSFSSESTENTTKVSKPSVELETGKPGVLPDRVIVGENPLDEDDFEIEDGKLIIKPEVFENLEDGRYEITIEYGDEVITEEIFVENGTPLIGDNRPTWSLFDLVMTIIVFGFMILYFIQKNEKEEIKEGSEEIHYEENEGKERSKKRLWAYRIAGILLAILTLIFLILTQDFSLPMAIFDQYSVYFALIALFDLFMFIACWNRKEDEEDQMQHQ